MVPPADQNRAPSAGDTVDPDELKDDLETYEHLQELAERFFAAKQQLLRHHSVSAVSIAHKTILASAPVRLKEVATPAVGQRLAAFGLTGQFVTAISLIPLIFILFLSILHKGNEGVTPFVYALF